MVRSGNGYGYSVCVRGDAGGTGELGEAPLEALLERLPGEDAVGSDAGLAVRGLEELR
jgi:hypothetical protein